MTPDETRLLSNFLSQLGQVSGVSKDPQAASMIAEAVTRQPDAAYLLVQRSLLQDQALAAATARIAALEAQSRATPAASSFLDAGSNAWGRGAVAAPQSAPAPQPNGLPMQAVAAYAAPAPSRFFGGGGGGSFLTSMAATAAGVAGGAFLFQGIESLMGHHHDGAHLMDQSQGFGGMADSVDHVGNGQSPLLDTGSSLGTQQPDNFAASDPDDVPASDVLADDSASSSDDSII